MNRGGPVQLVTLGVLPRLAILLSCTLPAPPGEKDPPRPVTTLDPSLPATVGGRARLSGPAGHKRVSHAQHALFF